MTRTAFCTMAARRGGRPAADPTVVWFDPGGTSGWAVFSVHPQALVDPAYLLLQNITLFTCGQFTGAEAEMLDAMLELCDAWPDAAIGSEQFKLRKFSQDDNLLVLERLNAVLSYELRRHGRDRKLHLQQPSLAFTTVTDARMQAWGYWSRTEGMDDARSATKHALTFLKRLKTQPKLRAGVFPSVG
jgi:hypothetical protein